MVSIRPIKGVSLLGRVGVLLFAGWASAVAAQAAPVQWELSLGGNGHWYEAVWVPDGITWLGARAAAEARGGYLVTIQNAAENAFVYELVTDARFWFQDRTGCGNGPWLGGYQDPTAAGYAEGANHRTFTDGGWRWVNESDGASFDSYHNWSGLEPNNDCWGVPETYVCFYGRFAETGLEWNDLPDEGEQYRPYGYIVEYDTASAIPEPSSWALLACSGLAGIMLRRRRKA